jgi:hypothetical protein
LLAQEKRRSQVDDLVPEAAFSYIGVWVRSP